MNPTKPRRLMFVISSLAIGGPQKSLIGLLQRLDPEYFDVSVLVLDASRSALRGSVPDHVRVVEAPLSVRRASLPPGQVVPSLIGLVWELSRKGQLRTLARLCWVIASSAALRRPGQQIRQHVWRCVSRSLPQVAGRFDASFGILGSSTYATVDLVDADYRYHWVRSDSRVLGRDQAVERDYFSRISGALAVSASCERIFVEMYPSMSGRTQVYKNDIPVAGSSKSALWPTSPRGGRRVLTVARLDRLKGLDLALDACAILTAQGLNIHWVVLGGGPEEANLMQEIERRGMGDYFTLAGAVVDTEPYLRAAEIYVHPSRAEGRSNSVEEARARGVAIVATDYPTVRDQVLDGVDGIVCSQNAGAIAAAVAHLLGDTGVRALLGRAAMARYAAESEDPNLVFAALSRGDIGRRHV